MAKITLENLAHSYLPNPQSEDDYALKQLDHDWDDGAAYALLGSSGCGKSTLLNIISGLLIPSQGRILFDGQDVTRAPTAERNIAQVFQFPVVYDTMTVRDNLAFPLRNRGRDEAYVAERGGNLPQGVKLDVWNDATYYLEGRLGMMVKNLAMGALLVFIILALFLEIKLAFWVMLGIPVCFLGAMAIINNNTCKRCSLRLLVSFKLSPIRWFLLSLKLSSICILV